MLRLLCLAKEVRSENYAFMVAGSNTYRNYRHQSDVFQMYQILHDRGLPDDHKILMAYNDIYDNSENPKKGKVFNIRKHFNIFPGESVIDYSSKDVSAANVGKVLTGHEGKVLKSGSKDDVFIYYNDHGAPGYLCFPSDTGGHLTAKAFSDYIKKMQEEKKFKRLFIVIESCYSGSVGKLLNGMKNVICITAASESQSSYSFGYDFDIKTFRTNEFTHNFFTYILSHPEATIKETYEYTKIYTYGSDVQLFGDLSLQNLPLSTFLLKAEPVDQEFENAEFIEPNASLPAMKTQMAYYKARAADASTTESERKSLIKRLKDEYKRRSISRQVMARIAAPFIDQNDSDLYEFNEDTVSWNCYEKTVEQFRKSCGEFDEFEMERLSMFSKLCDITEGQAKPIINRIKFVCPHVMWHLINID